METEHATPPADAPARIRIIVADDDPLARRALRDALQAAGVIVIAEAVNGREAIELARHYRPDVVLMDVIMPGIDGLEATRIDPPRCAADRGARPDRLRRRRHRNARAALRRRRLPVEGHRHRRPPARAARHQQPARRRSRGSSRCASSSATAAPAPTAAACARSRACCQDASGRSSTCSAPERAPRTSRTRSGSRRRPSARTSRASCASCSVSSRAEAIAVAKDLRAAACTDRRARPARSARVAR